MSDDQKDAYLNGYYSGGHNFSEHNDYGDTNVDDFGTNQLNGQQQDDFNGGHDQYGTHGDFKDDRNGDYNTYGDFDDGSHGDYNDEDNWSDDDF